MPTTLSPSTTGSFLNFRWESRVHTSCKLLLTETLTALPMAISDTGSVMSSARRSSKGPLPTAAITE